MKNGLVVLLAVLVAGGAVAYVRHVKQREEANRAEVMAREARPPSAGPRAPEYLQVTPDLSVRIATSAVPNAQYLCSKCIRPFPASGIRVVPTYDVTHGWVGSYRCAEHQKGSFAESRARLAADASVDEVGGMLDVLVSRGVSRDTLRPLTAGKSQDRAALAVLDAVERGDVVIPLQ